MESAKSLDFVSEILNLRAFSKTNFWICSSCSGVRGMAFVSVLLLVFWNFLKTFLTIESIKPDACSLVDFFISSAKKL